MIYSKSSFIFVNALVILLWSLTPNKDKSGFLVERLGSRGAEFPIIFEDRRVGKSKMSYQIVIEAFTYIIGVALWGQAGTSKQPVTIALTTKEKLL